MTKHLENERKLAAKAAVELIRDDMTVGLGTGSTAFYAINEIGELVSNGLRIMGVATSNKTREHAESLNIPLVDIDSVNSIDIYN